MSRASLAARVRPSAERTMRVRHRMVQTPVVRFEHPRTGHLPGLAAGLQRAGYRRQASAWLNAGRLPPLSVSARVVWAALRASQGSEASEASGDSAGSSGM